MHRLPDGREHPEARPEAGTITAVDNDLGVIGVSPVLVDLFIVKIFDNAGEWVPQARASNLTAVIDSNYTVADFSQFTNSTELAAPGVGVLSTVPHVPKSLRDVNEGESLGKEIYRSILAGRI